MKRKKLERLILQPPALLRLPRSQLCLHYTRRVLRHGGGPSEENGETSDKSDDDDECDQEGAGVWER
jgi:hypothetical protein